MTNPVCPYCGLSNWEEGPKFNGHKSYCKQHPESRKGKPETPTPQKSSTPKSSPTITVSSTQATSNATTASTLQPVTFSFSEGERLPSQQEIPEFKTPEQEKAEARKGEPETVKATLAEERKAGVSAIAALILPLFGMANAALAGESIQIDKERLKLNSDDADMLAQAIILVDNKHGGPLSKTLGGDYGPEFFLAGVCLGLGIKVTMMLRMRAGQARRPMRPNAAPSPEEIPREKSPIERVGESLRNLVTPPKKEEKKEETTTEEGFVKLSPEAFMEEAERRRREAANIS